MLGHIYVNLEMHKRSFVHLQIAKLPSLHACHGSHYRLVPKNIHAHVKQSGPRQNIPACSMYKVVVCGPTDNAFWS